MPATPLPEPPLRDGEISLRPWIEADVPAIVACCQDAAIPRWTQVPSPYGEEDARKFLGEAEGRRQEGRELALAVVDAADDGRLLGAVGLELGAEERIGELGYWIAREARGAGTAARAVRRLSEWAVRELHMQRLEVMAHPLNEASQRVALRAGFKREGLLRAYRERKGAREDRVMFSLLPRDLEKPAVHFRPEWELRPATEGAIEVHGGR